MSSVESTVVRAWLMPRWIAAAAWMLALASSAVHAADALPSWREGHAKQRIVAFVKAVTDKGGKHFVATADRIAVFDNDGTLWSEQPMYFQLAFALDRVRALAPSNPSWSTTQPFKAALEGDAKALAEAGEKGLVELVMAAHAGTTTDEFAQIVKEWAKDARHPKLGRRYTELTYRPMRELLDYLRAHGFRTYIVSGGGVEFLRALSQELYGIPPENVIGSSIRTKYEVRDGKPTIVRLPEVEFIDDKAGKPVGIHKFIGRRPIAAFGNSDGDFEMLEYVKAGPGPRLAVLVHHDDAALEFAYDRDSHVGRLARGLDEAGQRDWLVVSMKTDWRAVYAPPR
jgi:phosphoserine phosphatase